MNKTVINVNLYPKSGYRFVEKDGSVHTAGTWPGVMNKVISYRRRQGVPIGDVEAEVTAQACANNPAYCFQETDEQRMAYRKTSIKGRVLQFLSAARKAKDEGKLVFGIPQDAVNRAHVCSLCPFNTKLPTGCGSCNQARKEGQLYVLGRDRVIDPRMHGCVILGEDLVVAAHLERVVVDVPELPAHCWRKKTL